MSPEPADVLERDTSVRLCLAWDMAYSRMRETGDTLTLDPAVVLEAEATCSVLAERA